MKPRFVVAQLGARMHYAVPEILERNDALCHLFTDFYYKDGPVYSLFDLFASKISGYSRLKKRRAALPDAKVTYYPVFGILNPILFNRLKSFEAMYAHFNSTGPTFNQKIIRELARKNPDFDSIYTFTGAGLELMKKYKNRAKLVHEQISLPHRRVREILEVERRKHSDWGVGEAFGPHYKAYEEREIEELQLADLILCGSAFARDGIVSIDRALAPKIRVVPYGVSYEASTVLPKEPYDGKRKLRVFTAGKLGILKGYPYVLEAAKALHSRVEFRIAGNFSEVASPKLKELAKYTDLLGIVDSKQMPDHYNWADVFLFPSMCEGSAVVIYEALQFGLPVITTPNSGSIVADGVEGLIISPGNGEEVVRGLEEMLDHPDRLNFFARNAGVKAKEASVEAYERNFLNALF